MQVHIDLNVTRENSNLFWMLSVNDFAWNFLPSPESSRDANRKARGGKNQHSRFVFISLTFHFPISLIFLDMLMPLEACSTKYFGADTITQFNHFIGFFVKRAERRGLDRLLPLFAFYFVNEKFFLDIRFPSLSSRTTSENNFFNSQTNWHFCQVLLE